MAKTSKVERAAIHAMNDAAHAAKQAKRVAKELPKVPAKKIRSLADDVGLVLWTVSWGSSGARSCQACLTNVQRDRMMRRPIAESSRASKNASGE